MDSRVDEFVRVVAEEFVHIKKERLSLYKPAKHWEVFDLRRAVVVLCQTLGLRF